MTADDRSPLWAENARLRDALAGLERRLDRLCVRLGNMEPGSPFVGEVAELAELCRTMRQEEVR